MKNISLYKTRQCVSYIEEVLKINFLCVENTVQFSFLSKNIYFKIFRLHLCSSLKTYLITIGNINTTKQYKISLDNQNTFNQEQFLSIHVVVILGVLFFKKKRYLSQQSPSIGT